jgi:outer membrane receptor for ferrienterochelin and colicins
MDRMGRARCCVLATSVLAAALGGISQVARADDAGDAGDPGDKPLSEYSLEELLQIPVAVVTRTERPQEATPGIVTLVTREEIAASGARDLVDVLQRVPGFAFATDVQGQLALGFRGNTGAGGEILILVDGQELNETLYGTPLLHYPVDLIERIEISRGPGSVVHGGYAELAVINIISRGAGDAAEVVLGARYGQMDHSYGYRDVQLALRQRLGEVAISVAAFLGEGRRSDATYRDFFGNAYRLPNQQDPALINVAVGYRGLSLRLIGDWMHTTSRDGLAVSEPAAVSTDFESQLAELTYTWHLGDGLTLTPRLAYKRQRPWRVTDDTASSFYEKTAERTTAALTLGWALPPHVELLAGAEVFTSEARLDDTARVGVGLQRPLAGGDTDEFSTVSGFAQVLVDHPIANLSLGARVEHNSRFGTVLLPRIGVTRRFGRFHAKLLVSQAFRAPGHEPFSLNVDLRPEKTTTYEVEAGYRVGAHVLASANLYDLTINDPFVYDFDPSAGTERYFNFARTGSRGFEAAVRAQYPDVRGELTWSFYDAAGRNQVALYAVPGDEHVTSGFPAHKVTASATVRIADDLELSPTVILLGPRVGPAAVDAGGAVVFGRQDATLLVDLFLVRHDLAVPGLELGVGVADLLDQGIVYPDRSAIAHAPLPGPTREYLLRVTYRHDLAR